MRAVPRIPVLVVGLIAAVGCSTASGGAGTERPAGEGEGVTRTYYIAADEVVWDYAPSGTNLSEGRAFNDDEKPWMEVGPHFIGRTVKKALYREYTDETF